MLPAKGKQNGEVRPPAKEIGTQGRKISLLVNYFPLQIPSGNVYHYDVGITIKKSYSEECSTGIKSKKSRQLQNKEKYREIINAVLQNHCEFQGIFPAYDGQKNLYTRTPLNVSPLTVLVELQKHPRGPGFSGDVGDVFEVSIKPVCKRETKNNAISLDSIHEFFNGTVNEVRKEAVMAVETILRSGPRLRFETVGRSLFRPPEGPQDMHPLSGGKQIWYGHKQSLIVGQWQPMVKINVTAAAFYKSSSMINYVGEKLNLTTEELYCTPQLKIDDIIRLSKRLSGLTVTTGHLGYKKKYRVLKLTTEAANQLDVSLINPEEKVRNMKVSDFFLEKYNIKLKYPHLPCLQAHPVKKKTYLPLEMCDVLEGQHVKERLNQSEVSEITKATNLAPEYRFAEIQRAVDATDFNNDPCNVEFGVRVSSTPLQVEGRVIDPPNVMYLDNSWIRPVNGSWGVSGKKFLNCSDVKCWVILSFVDERHCRKEDLNRFSDLLSSIAQDYGMNMGKPLCIELIEPGYIGVSNVLENIQVQYRGINLVVVILEGKKSPLYAEIKQISETKLGLTTQCINVENIKKMNRAIALNICQKINTKLGGLNHSLNPREGSSILDKPVIVIGADVTHPSPGSGNRKPSIAAVVGSLDAHLSRYAVICRAQSNRDRKKKSVEIILDLKNMVMHLLKAFYRSNNCLKPEKIIFIRDGVSSSQLETVRDCELRSIHDACRSMGSEYEPAITFIVVQKRHNTRFIPEDPRDRVGRMGNVPPGTVVDTVACSRDNLDFFLCSHLGYQGTSRPCHYTVISDDSKFSSDDIQGLMYQLCHTYARCTKSISLPSPVMYAHLAAYRCTKYMEAHFNQQSDSSDLAEKNQQSDSSDLAEKNQQSGSSDCAEENLERLEDVWSQIIQVKPELHQSMYFI